MKKSILTLAVAAALAIPLVARADTILYGSARMSVDYVDVEQPNLNENSTALIINKNSSWDVFNNDSRLGILGSEDLGSGLSAVYRYEFGVDATEGGNFYGSRPKYVGLQGNFGRLTLGTQDTPYYNVAGIVDVFNSGRTFGADMWLGGSFSGFEDLSGAFFGEAARDSGSLIRLSKSVYYTTPDFNGFSAEAMLVMNGNLNKSEYFSDGIDLWNLAAKYSNGPFFAGVSYIKLDGDKDAYPRPNANDPFITENLDMDQWVVGLGYDGGPFTVGFIYEQGTLNRFGWINNLNIDGNTLGDDDATNYYLTGSYMFGNNIVRAAYGQLDPGTEGIDKIDNFVLGYQYNFSKRTRIWVEYIGRRTDPQYNVLETSLGGIAYGGPLFFGDRDAISIGTRVDF